MNRKTIPFMSLQLISSMMEFFDDIPLNMRNFKYPLLLMMAEHEQLVSNKTSEECFDKAGSFIKEKVVFKDAYHELQKDLQKDKVHARVLHFITNTILKNSPHVVKPFGKLDESKVRHGYLPKRRPPLFSRKEVRRKLLLGLIIYLIIGITIAKKWFPSWKYNQLRVVLVWPLLILVRILIGKRV